MRVLPRGHKGYTRLVSWLRAKVPASSVELEENDSKYTTEASASYIHGGNAPDWVLFWDIGVLSTKASTGIVTRIKHRFEWRYYPGIYYYYFRIVEDDVVIAQMQGGSTSAYTWVEYSGKSTKRSAYYKEEYKSTGDGVDTDYNSFQMKRIYLPVL